MKLNFPLLDEPLEFDKTLILALEEPEVFSNIAKVLYNYNVEGNLKLVFDDFSPVKESQLMLIPDVLSYNINTPSNLKLIYSDLEKQFNEKQDLKAKLEVLASEIANIISGECLENELNLEYDEITLLELIKAMGVKVETSCASIYEKCYEIVRIFQYLSKKKLLVFINVGSYLTEIQFEKLLEYVELSSVTALFLEPRKLYNFPQYILDNDYYLNRWRISEES
ncbi:MAG: type II-A CRISPR-associated protein Csn2 [Lactobacillus sp.]|nr:type II-A CRISPR-associated protein Csn2 [Lactobacillus sp.]